MKRTKIFGVICSVLLLSLVAVSAAASDEIRKERIRFARGESSAVVEGSIRGYETVDYIVGAAKGQSMNVSMATRHGATYFNIMEPGEDQVAIFNGSTNGNQFEGTLQESGDFKIRVYMMRSAARRNETANYRLEVIITGASAHSGGGSHDAKVEGTKFHARSIIPCSMGPREPKTSCDCGVVREGGGSGFVEVTTPDGGTRTIFFENGKATGYDRNRSDRGEFRATKENDVYIIHIGQERYEIVEAVIYGG